MGTPGIRRLPSGRYQARFTGPDGVRRSAPVTFETRKDAATWLITQQADMARGLWAPAAKRTDAETFGQYAESGCAGVT